MTGRLNRPAWISVALATFAALSIVSISSAAHAAVSTTVTINGGSNGRTFDGVGAISGGGGNSRLLIDYPEPQRSQVLDYLFKPGFGGSLQALKIEIGGDTNSTDGAEPSIKHTSSDLNCGRGYEWWIAQQARARNPNIKLYGLAWGAPGWIGNHNFWSQDMIDYLIAWLGCAKSNGVPIDYLGGWNERNADTTWYVNMKKALVSNGYGNVKMVAADSFGWAVADTMQTDSALKGAIDVLGSHYVCGYQSSQSSCSSTANAIATGKQLWASENGSEDYNNGGVNVARGINRGYIDAKLTAYYNWPLVASVYPNLVFASDGLVLANQPWSGAYSVGKNAWAMAHTTQFTAPGWHYLDTSVGYLGGNRVNGSYVTLKSTNNLDYSTIIETMDATAAQTATFTVTGGLSTGAVHVWATNMKSQKNSDFFQHTTDVTPSGGKFTVTLQPGYVYSLTTTTGQGKGTVAGPSRAPLALPYSDTFESYANGKEARYLSDMEGAFETVSCGGGRSGRCVRQMASTAPISWATPSEPNALLGDIGWTDYTVSTDALLEQAGYVELLGRVSFQGKNGPGKDNGYYLRVTNAGGWSILKNTTGGTFTTLASGSRSSLGTNTWHTYALSFTGTTITAKVDGTTLGSVTDASYGAGLIGIGNSGWQNAQFDNLTVTPTTSSTLSGVYEIVNRNSGKALDLSNESVVDGGLVDQWAYHSGANQQWQVISAGGGYYKLINVGSGKALDVPGQSTTAGVQLDQWEDNGGTNQQWTLRTSGGYTTILGRGSGLALDVSGGSTADGGIVVQWTSNAGTNQQWQLIKLS